MQPYPPQDEKRKERLIEDIVALMHAGEPDEKKTKLVGRWIDLLLQKSRGKPWWFLKNVASGTLDPGQDLIDLKGDIDRVVAIFAPSRLEKVSLSKIVAMRAYALEHNKPNAGPPAVYALEGRRVHLWPCPSSVTPCFVLYTRPLSVEIVPEEWEQLIISGVLGYYAGNYDRDNLMYEPRELKAEYKRDLRAAVSDSLDIDTSTAWDDLLAAAITTAQAPSSVSDDATDIAVPASLTGIGHTHIYPLEVQ
ncbi:MAG: hypothetical protein RPU39_13750 [Candidatus Sedimenticola sp. (ex Thyasira tokunagai)]